MRRYKLGSVYETILLILGFNWSHEAGALLSHCSCCWWGVLLFPAVLRMDQPNRFHWWLAGLIVISFVILWGFSSTKGLTVDLSTLLQSIFWSFALRSSLRLILTLWSLLHRFPLTNTSTSSQSCFSNLYSFPHSRMNTSFITVLNKQELI